MAMDGNLTMNVDLSDRTETDKTDQNLLLGG
jgi:hypothetical protein